MSMLLILLHVLALLPLRYSRLQEAFANDNLAEFKRLIEREGENIHERPMDSMTYLHLAVWTYKPEFVSYLLESGLDPNDRDREGNTPLHLLSYVPDGVLGCEEAPRSEIDRKDSISLIIATRLLRSGADLNARNERQRTPIQTISSYENFRAMQLLLDRGAQVKELTGPSLIERVWHGPHGKLLVERLLKAGVSPTRKAWVDAVGNGNYEIAQLMLDAGLKVEDWQLAAFERERSKHK